jgi:hypothetical protein
MPREVQEIAFDKGMISLHPRRSGLIPIVQPKLRRYCESKCQIEHEPRCSAPETCSMATACLARSLSPLRSTTQSRATGDFPAAAKKARIGGVFGACSVSGCGQSGRGRGFGALVSGAPNPVSETATRRRRVRIRAYSAGSPSMCRCRDHAIRGSARLGRDSARRLTLQVPDEKITPAATTSNSSRACDSCCRGKGQTGWSGTGQANIWPTCALVRRACVAAGRNASIHPLVAHQLAAFRVRRCHEDECGGHESRVTVDDRGDADDLLSIG